MGDILKPEMMEFEGSKVRFWMDQDDNITFVFKDLCQAATIDNDSQAVKRISEDDLDWVILNDPMGRQRRTRIVNEGGFYDLVIDSKKPAGLRLKKKVTHEILPSIRKTGSYSSIPQIAAPMTLLESLKENVRLEEKRIELEAQNTKLIEENHKQVKQLEQAEPYINLAKSILGRKSSISAKEFADNIAVKGLGRDNLLKWMRDRGYLLKSKPNWNQPWRPSVEQGLITTKISERINSEGKTENCKPTPMFTIKGVAYFTNKIKLWLEAKGEMHRWTID